MELLKKFRNQNKSVYHVIQESPAEIGFLIKGSEGAKQHPKLKALDNENIVFKTRPNSFLGTSLLESLQKEGVQKLVITGFMANMCVDSTVRAAKDLGFDVEIIPEAIAACPLGDLSHLQVKAAFLAGLEIAFAKVTPLGEFISN